MAKLSDKYQIFRPQNPDHAIAHSSKTSFGGAFTIDTCLKKGVTRVQGNESGKYNIPIDDDESCLLSRAEFTDSDEDRIFAIKELEVYLVY